MTPPIRRWLDMSALPPSLRAWWRQAQIPQSIRLATPVVMARAARVPALFAGGAIARGSLPPATEGSIRRLVSTGLFTGVVLVGGLFTWAAFASLSGAVVSPGVIVVDSSTKKIQHPSGGVIGEIRVREGQFVPEGAVLARLDETVTRSNLQIVVSQLNALLGRQARLQAERDGAEDILFPASLVADSKTSDDARHIIQGERGLLTARRDALAGQKSQLEERIVQLSRETEGLEAQLEAKQKEVALIASELGGLEDLYRKNLVPITRVMQLRRENTRLQGERGALISQIAATKGKISETKLQILNLDQDRRTEVSRDLRDAESKIAELAERRTAAEDQLRRIDIKAPADGFVHQLAIHTVGGVIQPGETVMIVVPQNDSLTIESRVSPMEIEQVKAGTRAVVKLTGFSSRTTPDLAGHVTTVSADATHDEKTGMSFFTVRVQLPEDEVRKLGDKRLIPGMPAEVFIETNPRTALSYLTKPLTDQFARAFRER
jgi:HlyD family secretion protein